MDTLDVTHLKLSGEKLAEEIENLVGETQRLVIQPLPSELLMTKEQFEDLISLADPDEQLIKPDPKHQLYLTKYNIMDIKIKGQIAQAISSIKGFIGV